MTRKAQPLTLAGAGLAAAFGLAVTLAAAPAVAGAADK
jgi:hypothetical protein